MFALVTRSSRGVLLTSKTNRSNPPPPTQGTSTYVMKQAQEYDIRCFKTPVQYQVLQDTSTIVGASIYTLHQCAAHGDHTINVYFKMHTPTNVVYRDQTDKHARAVVKPPRAPARAQHYALPRHEKPDHGRP